MKENWNIYSECVTDKEHFLLCARMISWMDLFCFLSATSTITFLRVLHNHPRSFPVSRHVVAACMLPSSSTNLRRFAFKLSLKRKSHILLKGYYNNRVVVARQVRSGDERTRSQHGLYHVPSRLLDLKPFFSAEFCVTTSSSTHRPACDIMMMNQHKTMAIIKKKQLSSRRVVSYIMTFFILNSRQ